MDTCLKKNDKLLTEVAKEIHIEVTIKKSPAVERFSIAKFDDAIEVLKGKEIRDFKVIYLKDFGKKFSSPRKFVEIIEQMLKDYYMGIVQHLNKWEPSAPKMVSKPNEVENEAFIDAVNDGDVVRDELTDEGIPQSETSSSVDDLLGSESEEEILDNASVE